MIRLQELEKVMRPQFVFDKNGKVLGTDEAVEGNKDLARNVFVGISDMYGFDPIQVCEYSDMGYLSYRHKLQQFREYYREAKRREADGELNWTNDSVRKFYTKVCLCMNAIQTTTKRNPYLKLHEYLEI